MTGDMVTMLRDTLVRLAARGNRWRLYPPIADVMGPSFSHWRGQGNLFALFRLREGWTRKAGG